MFSGFGPPETAFSMTLPSEQRPIAGAGLGLRSPHYGDLMAGAGDVPWLEVLADNYAHGAVSYTHLTLPTKA